LNLARVKGGRIYKKEKTFSLRLFLFFSENRTNLTLSDSWAQARHHGLPLNDSQGRVFLWSHSGLWERCDYFLADPDSDCIHHHEFLAERGREVIAMCVQCDKIGQSFAIW
jgi:hypothetical protein